MQEYCLKELCTLIAMNILVQHNSAEQPDPVQQDTLVYAEILGPSSFKNRAKHNMHVVTLRPDDMDDRVEYALLNHGLQKPVISTNQTSITGKIIVLYILKNTCN